tara:strand:+ start:306 stop:1118 length:813 start_codon:yes stop_codon:yes gene_type:complete
MILFPPSKLNLGLQIIAKRNDGYHNLQTVFYQFPLNDILEILKDDSLSPGTCMFNSSGLLIPSGQNLCEKAYYLLTKYFNLPGVQIHLHKIIPLGAGLGGGSSDAAYTLRLLNTLFDLKISETKLMDYAIELGSDCPFFIRDYPQYAEGRGEVLEPIEIDLKGKHLLIINPNIHISTKEAFATIKPTESISCKKIVLQDISTWKENLSNDFEASIFPTYQVLKTLKNKLYDVGALYACMSGSGSTMYAIFNEKPELEIFPKDYFVWETQL